MFLNKNMWMKLEQTVKIRSRTLFCYMRLNDSYERIDKKTQLQVVWLWSHLKSLDMALLFGYLHLST